MPVSKNDDGNAVINGHEGNNAKTIFIETTTTTTFSAVAVLIILGGAAAASCFFSHVYFS